MQEQEDRAEDDAKLMQCVAEGDTKAFNKLMQRHLSKTVRLAERMLGRSDVAEDIAQESFVRVWKNAAHFEAPERAGAQFTTWLYKIVLNLVIDEKRKRHFVAIDAAPEEMDARPHAEDRLQQKEQSIRVKKALAALPDRQRAAFILCFYEGFSNKEAAAMLKVSVKGIESLLVRARRQLREALRAEKGDQAS